jgi:predicted ATPase
MERPNVVVIAGPNGAGKSTLAESILVSTLGIRQGADEKMSTEKEINIPEILKDRPRVQKALRDAVQKAIRFHKLMGRPIIV